MLDSNGDGLISAQKIDISMLKHEILEILMPLFWEMEEMGQTLDCKDFIEALKRLYNTLTVTEKNRLLAVSHKWEVKRHYENFRPSFEPKINKRSKMIAKDRMLEGENIHHYFKRKQLEFDEKIEKIRDYKMNQELVGWTFQPQIYNDPVHVIYDAEPDLNMGLNQDYFNNSTLEPKALGEIENNMIAQTD